MKQIVQSPKLLGAAIKRARKSKKLNQKQAGYSFNIEQSTVSSIEQGASGTRLDTLFRMLAALDLELVIQTKNADAETNEEW